MCAVLTRHPRQILACTLLWAALFIAASSFGVVGSPSLAFLGSCYGCR